MKKYWGMFKNSFASILEYKSNLIGLVILQLMGAGAILIWWLAAFKTTSQIGGYNFSQVALYYLLAPLIGIITQVFLSNWLGWEIKDGKLSKSLLKPFNFWLGCFMRVLSEKANQLMILFPFYFLIGLLLFYFLNGLTVSLASICLCFLMAIMAFLMHFLLDLAISFLSFWVDDVWCFGHLKIVAFGVLGGMSFPFEFLPQGLKAVFNALPFKFMYYTPLGYLLGKRGLANLPGDLAQIILWALLFFCLSIILWKRGLIKYEAFGN